jgi:cell wall-associated NlpC family hydrolase
VTIPGGSSAGMYSALDEQMIGRSLKSINKAKTGDIIFFKSGRKVSHVGLYYKDGKMIHAANPRKDVCIDKVSDYERWGFEVVGIARVIN